MRHADAALASAAVLERAAADGRGERARGDRVHRAHPERVQKLRENARYFREQITEAGFKPLPGETPIVPIIVGETAAAIQMSDMLLEEGVFVTGFGFPGGAAGPGARALPAQRGASRDGSRRGDCRVQDRREEARNNLRIV